MKRTAITAAVIAATTITSVALAGDTKYPCGGHGDSHKSHHKGDHHHKKKSPCNCVGEKGEKGDTGATGPAGPQGPAGQTVTKIVIPTIRFDKFKVPAGAATCQFFPMPNKQGTVIRVHVACIGTATTVKVAG